MPNRSLPSLRKNVGPKPIVRVSAEGESPRASPVSAGGAYGLSPMAPCATASPSCARPSRSTSSASRRRRPSCPSGVESGEVHPVLRGGDDARLVGAAERHRLGQAVVDDGRGGAAGQRAGGGGADDGGRHPGSARKLAPAPGPPDSVTVGSAVAGWGSLLGDDTLHLADLLAQGVDGAREVPAAQARSPCRTR